MAGRPAPLEGSLLARKGDATPVIPDDSPLMESVEGATSDVVPLHRVETPEPAPPPVAPPLVETTAVSPHRRAAIILVVLLVLFLVAVALAARGHRNGSVSGPAAAVTSGPVATSVPADLPAGSAPAPVPKAVSPEPAPPDTAPSEPGPPDTASPEGTVAAVPSDSGTEPVPADPAPQPAQSPEAATPESAPAPPSKLYVLQFASVRDEDRAMKEAVRLQKRIGGALGGRKVVVVSTEVRGRKRYRLRAGSFDSLRVAIAACRNIARLKVDCLPIRR